MNRNMKLKTDTAQAYNCKMSHCCKVSSHTLSITDGMVTVLHTIPPAVWESVVVLGEEVTEDFPEEVT